MFGKKESARANRIDTLIGQTTEIKGDVVFSGGLHVDGRVRGNVLAEDGSDSVLSLSERGHIEGDIRVPNIVLNGKVVGDVHASVHIELDEKAQVSGNVYYRFIEMKRGAEVNGNLVHQAEGNAPKVALAAAKEGAVPAARKEAAAGNT